MPRVRFHSGCTLRFASAKLLSAKGLLYQLGALQLACVCEEHQPNMVRLGDGVFRSDTPPCWTANVFKCSAQRWIGRSVLAALPNDIVLRPDCTIVSREESAHPC